jgi:hypothetical protein
MLESPNYVASTEAGELVPQLTLNKFNNAEDEWTWWEKLQIVFKMFTGDEMGMFNITSIDVTSQGTTTRLCGGSALRTRTESTWR